MLRYLDEQKDGDVLDSVCTTIAYALSIRPLNARSLLSLSLSIGEKTGTSLDNLPLPGSIKYRLTKMMKNGTNLFEERSIGRAIVNDDVDALSLLLAKKKQEPIFILTDICNECGLLNGRVSLIKVSAFFGSVKCFKYLLMSGAEIDESICLFAIAGGCLDIIHILEQHSFKFDDCLEISIA